MIKPIKKINLPECLEVIRRSFQSVADEFGLTPENCPTNGAFTTLERLLNDYKNGDKMYAQYEKTSVVGFVQLAEKENGVFVLQKLAVLPEYRHKGYGGQLIYFSKKKVAEFGGKIITIGIIEDNTRLKNWYAENGFVHTGTRIFAHLPFTVGFMEMQL